jgi:hypothetical protein
MCMYEFAVGFAIGVLIGKRRMNRRVVTYDIGVQVSQPVQPTHPIFIRHYWTSAKIPI